MEPSCTCSYHGVYCASTVARICSKEGVSAFLARALIRRGITADEQVHAFLHPSEDDLKDPFLLPDMAAAVRRIREAIMNDERICVYGDYDADGVCATAILTGCLRELGADVFYYIPSRHTEGYGMNRDAVEQIVSFGARLIVTVDNGISAHTEAELCIRLGVDLVVTDHHQPSDKLPDALAVVAASRSDSRYENPYLCGAGIAYKLTCALQPSYCGGDRLALAAIATVADVVPMLGENRSIVALGCKELAKLPGIHAMLICAGSENRVITSETLGFLIAPRLNAAGRMGDAARAVELLLAKDFSCAEKIAAELEEENRRRRAEELRIMIEIDKRFSDGVPASRRAIVLCGEDWHLGVIGIVAARLCEKHHCPTLLFGKRDGMLIGSCRSVPEINLYDCLSQFAGYFVRFGGHAGAAGITMQPDDFEAFSEAFNRYLMANYTDDAFSPVFRYEEDVRLEDLSTVQVEEFERLRPFGEGNPEPVFRMIGTQLREVKQIGQQGAHLSCSIFQQQHHLRAVGFGLGEQAALFCKSGTWTALGIPQINVFGGNKSVEIRLITALSDRNDRFLGIVLHNFLYNIAADYDIIAESFFETHGRSPFHMLETSPDALRRGYMALRARIGRDGIAYSEIEKWDETETVWPLCLFLELGFFEADVYSKLIKPVQAPNKRRLEDSKLYRMAVRDMH